MTFQPDLARYFQRIGYAGPSTSGPDLAQLDAIIFAHVRSIPFENLDVLLGRPIDLTPAAIENKLLIERRGGYCFEQNTWLLHVLRALGYSVTAISARVRVGRPREYTPPRTHMLLRVELADGTRLVDVGVGGLSPTSALRLVADERQETPHEPRRIVRLGRWQELSLRAPDAVLVHQAFFDDAWQDVCELTLEPMAEIDRELGNWYTSTHPASHFKDKVMVALATATGRKTLLNRRLSIRGADGSSEVHRLRSPAELHEVLAGEFGIVLPPGAELRCAGLDWQSDG